MLPLGAHLPEEPLLDLLGHCFIIIFAIVQILRFDLSPLVLFCERLSHRPGLLLLGGLDVRGQEQEHDRQQPATRFLQFVPAGVVFDDLRQHGLEVLFALVVLIEDLELAGELAHGVVLVLHGDELVECFELVVTFEAADYNLLAKLELDNVFLEWEGHVPCA